MQGSVADRAQRLNTEEEGLAAAELIRCCSSNASWIKEIQPSEADVDPELKESDQGEELRSADGQGQQIGLLPMPSQAAGARRHEKTGASIETLWASRSMDLHVRNAAE